MKTARTILGSVPSTAGTSWMQRGVEEVEIARFKFDAALSDVVQPGVFVKGVFGNVGLDVFRPQAAMQDRLGRRPGLSRVLKAEDAGELVFEPGRPRN